MIRESQIHLILRALMPVIVWDLIGAVTRVNIAHPLDTAYLSPHFTPGIRAVAYDNWMVTNDNGRDHGDLVLLVTCCCGAVT